MSKPFEKINLFESHIYRKGGEEQASHCWQCKEYALGEVEFEEVEDDFTRVQGLETVMVKGLPIVSLHDYDKCKECDALFDPHENKDLNAFRDIASHLLHVKGVLGDGGKG